MRYYTKEWYSLLNSLGAAELFEPVIDKSYTDEEIEDLYQEMLEKYVQEEHDLYDEPPFFITEDDDEEWEISEADKLAAVEAYENREPFDEEEAAREFEEQYKDDLEDPDEDIPQWVLDSVDPRLIAMGLLPESVYRKLKIEEDVREALFDKLDEEADEALEKVYDGLPEEYQEISDQLGELEGESVTDFTMSEDGTIVITMHSWDDEGDPVRLILEIEDAKILEKEDLVIETETDEDGDVISNCSIESHELYYGPDGAELHLLFDNEDEGLKYLTVRCSGISCTEEHL